MADEAHTHSNGDSTDAACATCSAHQQDSKDDVTEGQAIENTFAISVRLPHQPYKTQTIISTQDQAQDIRQSIVDVPHTFQYSCFHLERDGERIPDFVDIADIPGITPDAELTLVEDPYTEKDARIHFLRVRELIGAAGDRTDLVQGIQAGLSLHDHVAKASGTSSAVNGNGKNHKSDSTDSHAMTGYDISTPGSFKVLLPPTQEPPPKCIKSISLSPWNPPPYNLRLKGHLLYIQVTTNEGEQFQITSNVTGFFVNKASNSKFDPFPKTTPKSYSAHSLLSLISRLSPSFDATFKELQEYNGRRDPLSAFQPSNAIPASPWLVAPNSNSLSIHQADISRTQESYLVSGAENTETLRDWNEEFQTTRELPRETVQDRVFRERVTSKLFADYNEAAAQGAVLIARGEVAPLNPTENRDAQIFVYNNVFYSFGADGVGTFANEGGDEAARVATGKDVVGIRNVNQLDIHGLAAPGTIVVDYLGKRLVGQSIVPGIFKQREPGEQQIDYGGVEGKDVVAENEAFVPLFKRLSTAMRVKRHAVWDKEGKRHELEASIETKGLLGTDGRKYVLDLYRITPLDVSWIEQHWIEPSQSEEASQSKEGYPHRMTVLRPELVEAFWRMKLREYVKTEMAKGSAKSIKPATDEQAPSVVNGDGEKHANGHVNGDVADEKPDQADGDKTEKTEEEQERVDISGFQYALNPDVFSGQSPQTTEEKEEWAKDEAEVRAACDYLHSDVMPRLILDLKDGEVGFPMDGQSLSSLLHRKGINVRYLGKIAELSSKPEPRLQALKALAIQEMVSRAFKHIANLHLRYLPSPFSTSCIAHLLNCLLGAGLNGNPKSSTDEDLKSLYPEAKFEFEAMTPDTLRAELKTQVALRFRFDLESDWFSHLKAVQMLREVSLKLGLQLGAKEYVFAKDADYVTNGVSATNGTATNGDEHSEATTNGHTPAINKKKKKGGDRSPPRTTAPSPLPQTFEPDDFFNIVPVIKEASPKSVLAEEALEAGRISVVQNQKELGQELLLESLSLHEQIYGILHAEVARVYYQLSTLFYGLDDKNIAVELARKAVIVSERTLGVDSSETVLGYLNLGLFEHAVGNTNLALTYVRHALDLWKIVYGANHPDSITTINNAAVMLQHLKLYHDSRLWFEASLNICQEVSGKASVNTATLLFQLAQALALDQDSKGAVNRMREAYNIFNTELGPTDRNTKEAETWLEQLTQNAVSIAKHAKDLQARKMRRINQLTPRVTLGTRPQPQVGQSEQDAISGTRSSASGVGKADGGLGGLDERSIDELLRYIEGGDAGKASTPKKRTVNPKRQQRAQ